MTAINETLKNIVLSIPEFCKSHWLLRIPLTIIILQSGIAKFPLTVEDATSYDLPFYLWITAAIGEIVAGVALVFGGLVRGWFGDAVSRLGGLIIAGILVGVIVTTNWGSIVDILLYDHLHVLLLVAGLYFGLRGNDLTKEGI